MSNLIGRRLNQVGVLAAATALAAMTASAGVAPIGGETGKLKAYQTKYYVIHSDLDLDAVREAAARLTAMAEEYHRRTKGFSGAIRRRLPFYLFSKAEDYYAAGGAPGSAGVYRDNSLMAVASERRGRRLWKTVQHEGFHQFAHTVISRKLPVWVDEGLAEYFGHGIWTGDNYVTGLIPPGRLRRLKARIENEQIRPFLEMILMTKAEWNADLRGGNYDQAWSMVHFLVHGEGGEYQKGFSQFINDVAGGRPWKLAFVRRFGRNLDAFQERYARWWKSLSADPTGEKYTLATVQTLTSYLGRALSRRQQFADVGSFFKAARAGKLKCRPEQWLPPELLANALQQAAKLGEWSLADARAQPRLVLTRPDGATFTGTFVLRGIEIDDVEVAICPARVSPPKRASPSRPSAR